MQSPPCSLIAAARPEALASVRVVRTVKKPSLANFWAIAPPTPQRMPTGRALSSTALPCASLVLRPSACHFEVAPITTATGLPLLFRFPAILKSSPCDVRADCDVVPKGRVSSRVARGNPRALARDLY